MSTQPNTQNTPTPHPDTTNTPLTHTADGQAKDRDATTETLLKRIQSIVSIIFGLSALVTIGGFVVVSIHLGKVTSIHGYSLAVGQYIAAGIGFWIVGLPFGVLGAVGIRSGINTFIEWRLKRLGQSALARPEKFVNRLLFAGLLGFYVFVGGLLYGWFIYETIPRAVGGGAPPYIIIAFKETILPSTFGLSNAGEGYSHWSEPLLLLAELNDGLLVKEPNTSYVVTIRSDSFYGILDAATLQQKQASGGVIPSSDPTQQMVQSPTSESTKAP